MSEISFGRYINRNTPVHKVDPRTKFILLILCFVTIFLQFKIWSTSILISLLLFILLIGLMLVSKVRFRDLFKSLAGMWFLILFLLIIYILVPNTSYVNPAFKIGTLQIYWDAFYQCAYILIRIIMMICITMILTSTTKPMDLTQGMEWYMSPLTVIHFPSHEIAMTISIALRFIPTILDETSRIMKAQESRGVDYSHGNLFKRIGGVISLIIPLFVSAIERSEELANAMEARGYNPRSKRTSYHQLKFSYRDIIATLIVLLVFGGVLTLFIIDRNGNGIDLFKILFNVNIGF